MDKDTLVKDYNPVTPAVFLTHYNKNIPKSFPHATNKALEQFQIAYPRLFKNHDEWSVEKHRKRFMDWLSSQ